MSQGWTSRKVVIVGAGAVGATAAYALAQGGVAEELVLVDHNRELAEGQALDLAHGQPFYPAVNIKAGDAGDYADARVIVITAGAKQAPGETRLNLVQRNAHIVGSIIDEIVAQRSPAVVVCVTNPVDVMTAVAHRRSGWPRGRVLGSGTVLDSARFRYLLSRHCRVNVHSVHGYILGEHGDSEFAAWSMTNIAGIPIAEYCPDCGQCAGWQEARTEIIAQVRNSAYHIIGYKGATNFGIGMAMVQIVRGILRNEQRILTVSAWLAGEYDLHNLCLGLPCIVGAKGIERVLAPKLSAGELEELAQSAAALRGPTELALAQ